MSVPIVSSIDKFDLTAPVSRDEAKQLRLMLHSRALRRQHFDSDLFTNPAWDIMLELYTAALAQQRVSVSKCCVAANVPATTGLRHLSFLSERGLIVRCPDPLDRRRIFVSLSETGEAAMRSFLDATLQIAA